MTEPAVASSDATNIESSIVREGFEYVINGRKWWSSGAGDPRCKIAIFMGKTDFSGPRHKQQSMMLVPMDAPGIKVERLLTVYGYDHAPHGHAEVTFKNVRIPVSNILAGRGKGISKLRRDDWARDASIIACAVSVWLSELSKQCANAYNREWLLVNRSRSKARFAPI